MPLMDVQVSISVLTPAPRIGLGVPLILEKKVGVASYKEYFDLTSLAVDYASTTAAYKKAAAVFAQKNRPNKVAVATYDTKPSDTLKMYADKPFHFVLMANDLQADQVEAGGYMATQDFKMAVFQVSTQPALDALKTLKRVILYEHKTVGEHLDAAAVGEIGSLPVGENTWKFKELVGVTPRTLTAAEIQALDSNNVNAYVFKAGKAQTSEGKTANGEYIDVVHGQDWIKADMENELQTSLQNAGKVPYDNRGINLLEAAVTTTLQRGFRNGIIAEKPDGTADYSITAVPREQTDVQDRANRYYKGLSFRYGLAGAIHAAGVKGSINL